MKSKAATIQASSPFTKGGDHAHARDGMIGVVVAMQSLG